MTAALKTSRKKAEFKNGTVYYRDTGKKSVIVLLHGFLEDGAMWNQYTKKLAGKSRRVIAIDLPGHGNTDSFGYVHEMSLMADAVHAVLKKEGIRKVILAGHSMGGYTAMAFAEKYPDMVKGVCMFFSTARDDSSEKKDVRGTVSKLIKLDHESFIRKNIPMLFMPEVRKRFAPEIRELKKRASKMSKRAVLAANEGMRIRPDREIILRFAPYPVHFVIGRHDPVLAPESLVNQTKHGPHITYDLFENCGHMGHIERRAECFRSLRKLVVAAETSEKQL